MMNKLLYEVLILLLCVFPEQLSSYNVDTSLPTLLKAPEDKESYFGFSLAIRSSESILVGAPRVVKSDVNKKGGVYDCALATGSCTSVDSYLGEPNKVMDWFGVSVVASQNGRAMACSHRYYDESYDFSGFCVVYDSNMAKIEVLEPCKLCAVGRKSCSDKILKDHLHCQAGYSATMNSEGDVLIGAPRFSEGKGSIHLKTMNGEYVHYNKTTSMSKYGYLGTSVRMGRLIGHNMAYASGAPNMDINGLVVLFTSTKNALGFNNTYVLRGDKPFSAFGAELAVGDFNRDGYEDLVVGAPNYYEPGGTTGGAIYVYMNGPKGITSSTVPKKILSRKMKESECLSLKCYDARFGLSLANAGDLDQDGYPDLVVGAPFEGEGAVYIFPGSFGGLKERFSQRIVPSELGSPMRGGSFGYSFSQGPYDLDKNSYPDLAIGSFMTDRVVILRSRPVLNVERVFRGSPSILNYKTPTCEGHAGKLNCFNVTVCFKFSMKFDRSPTFDMQYNLSIAKDHGSMDRATFSATVHKPNITSVIKMKSGGNNQCEEHLVYIVKSNRDWLNAIRLTMTYGLHDLVKPSHHPLSSFDSYPVINNSLSQDKPQILVNFNQDCGDDEVCSCNLGVVLGSRLPKNKENRHEMKASETLKIDVVVSNKGEDAHQSMFYLRLPHHVHFVGIESSDSQTGCGLVLEKKNGPETEEQILACEIANPLGHHENVTFTIKLNPKALPANQESIKFEAHVNSTSKEVDQSNDKAALEFDILSEADFSLISQSSPNTIFFVYQEIPAEKEFKSIAEIGPSLEHVFEVKNIGKVTLPVSAITITWPKSLASEDPLFYMVAEPEVSGSGGNCTFDGDLLNPRHLNTDGQTQLQKLRKIREAETDIEDSKKLTCEQHLRCVEIHCSINALKPAESTVIRIFSRFWNSTFQKSFPDYDAISVMVTSELIIPPNVRQITTDNDKHKCQTLLLRDELKEEEAPIWIYLLAAAAGLFFLILFILILWKCGFFKRKKLEGMHEYSVTVTKKEINEADLK